MLRTYLTSETTDGFKLATNQLARISEPENCNRCHNHPPSRVVLQLQRLSTAPTDAAVAACLVLSKERCAQAQPLLHKASALLPAASCPPDLGMQWRLTRKAMQAIVAWTNIADQMRITR
jgi:hypothetical protein